MSASKQFTTVISPGGAGAGRTKEEPQAGSGAEAALFEHQAPDPHGPGCLMLAMFPDPPPAAHISFLSSVPGIPPSSMPVEEQVSTSGGVFKYLLAL